MDTAVAVAGWSPCQSKRGVVIFHGENFISNGCNAKPRGFDCDGSDACKATCRTEAVHAEQMALLAAGSKADRADLLHVKAIKGQLVPSGGPSCVQCSKLALVAGIAGVWLYHESGWRRYDAKEFHALSLRACADAPPSDAALTPEEMADAFLSQYKTTWPDRGFYLREHLIAFAHGLVLRADALAPPEPKVKEAASMKNELALPEVRPLTVVLYRDNGETLADEKLAAIRQGDTVIVNGVSELFFHQLRLRATQDPTLHEKIAVFWSKDGTTLERVSGLRLSDELRWPVGFLNELWEKETEIRAARQAAKADPVCEHGTALDVHCCNCHTGFIFDKDHECPAPPRADALDAPPTAMRVRVWQQGFDREDKALVIVERPDGRPFTRAEAHQIAAQVEACAAPTWQPIDSCPKDGTWFLAWDADCGFYVFRDGPTFIAAEDSQPTHWMPLPAAPPSPAAKETP